MYEIKGAFLRHFTATMGGRTCSLEDVVEEVRVRKGAGEGFERSCLPDLSVSKSIISKLKPSVGGLDGLPNSLLCQFPCSFASFTSHFSDRVCSSDVPAQILGSRIQEIPKAKPSHSTPKDWRDVSLYTSIGKVIKK